jgi:hypothetical protein
MSNNKKKYKAPTKETLNYFNGFDWDSHIKEKKDKSRTVEDKINISMQEYVIYLDNGIYDGLIPTMSRLINLVIKKIEQDHCS